MLKICSIGSRIGVSLFHSLSLSFFFLFHYMDTPKEKKVKLVSFGGVSALWDQLQRQDCGKRAIKTRPRVL